jgi:hypothetical protein
MGDHLEHPGVNGIIILKWIFKAMGMEEHGHYRSVSAQRLVAGCFDCGNEPSCSIKCEKLLD